MKPVYYIQVHLTKQVGDSTINRTCWVKESRIPAQGPVNIKIDGVWERPWMIVETFPNQRWTEERVEAHERTWLHHRGQTDV